MYMRIETFDDLYDATYFLETLAEEARDKGFYFKAELYKTDDNRWRVGFAENQQLEMNI